jgi:uncharacterized protein YbcI
MKAVPEGRRLIVSWELSGFVDVMTIEGLRGSLAAAESSLAETEEAVRRNRVRGSLSVIAGTG